jgi:hypothetical protein
MTAYQVPLKSPKPDIQLFLDTISGKRVPNKALMVEYLIDNAVTQPILEEMMGRTWVDTSDKTEYMGGQMEFSKENLRTINAWLDNQIAFWYHMGYDFVCVEASPPLPAISHLS